MIELLIVVAIIGILAALITVSVNVALTNAKIARVKQDLQTFASAVSIAEANTGEVLGQINGGSYGGNIWPGGGSVNFNNLSDSSGAVQYWYSLLANVQTACNGECNNISTMKRDPWGNPYGIDPNELEFSGALCRRDLVLSAGPNGIVDTSDSIINDVIPPCGGDDICYVLPFASGTCTNQ